ncbi:MAG: HAD family hydrolase [Verrucomicrobiota bacterium]
MLDALIFDFDGLILDTELPIYEAWKECYASYGEELPLEVYRQCVGSDFSNSAYHPDQELEKLVGRELPWETLRPRMEDRVQEIVAQKDALPGVRELLQEAHDAAVPCAIASSSSRKWVGSWLEKLELLPLFETLVNIDDVERPKPAPDLFQLAAERLGIRPDRALVLEDSLNGLKAAKTAGIRCLIVPNPVTRGLPFDGAYRERETLAGVTLVGLREEW